MGEIWSEYAGFELLWSITYPNGEGCSPGIVEWTEPVAILEGLETGGGVVTSWDEAGEVLLDGDCTTYEVSLLPS